MLELADLDRARKRLEGAIYESPCPYSQTLSELSGARCFVKLENLQMTGSFKDRGAATRLLQLNPAERARGVVAASAGNHGLAVAFHASRLGTPAVIVMPEWAPLIKVTSSRRNGAEVILHGANYDEAYGRAREVQAERGLTFVHPFDDERVIAGQGTLGLELLAQRPDMDAVLVPVGGGGLVGGVGLAIKSHRPEVRVIGVQAETLPAMKRALDARERVTLPPASTIADGIAVRQVGELTLALAQRHVDQIVTVSGEELANALLPLLERGDRRDPGRADARDLRARADRCAQGAARSRGLPGGGADGIAADGVCHGRGWLDHAARVRMARRGWAPSRCHDVRIRRRGNGSRPSPAMADPVRGERASSASDETRFERRRGSAKPQGVRRPRRA